MVPPTVSLLKCPSTQEVIWEASPEPPPRAANPRRTAAAPPTAVSGSPGSAGFARRACEPATRAAAHEVVDLVLGDERLELGQARRRVGAVETADRHDRDAVLPSSIQAALVEPTVAAAHR